MTAQASQSPSMTGHRDRARGCVAAGVATAVVGAFGVWAGLLAILGHLEPVRIDWLLPLAGVQLAPDPLGGFFMALTGAVAVPVGVYTIGYARREHLGPVPLTVLPLFVAAMLLVPAAGTVGTLLYGWELMAVASLILVLAEHHRAEVRSAALFYAVMTQLGFLLILVGLMLAAATAGSDPLTGAGHCRTASATRCSCSRSPGSVRRLDCCHCTPGCPAPTPRRPARCRR